MQVTGERICFGITGVELGVLDFNREFSYHI